MKRAVLISIMLILTMVISFLVPKPKYEGTNILDNMNIPKSFPGWRSYDISKELDLKDERYNFISDAFARVYLNRKGEAVLLLVLDAGNFHNPKVCYTSTGFNVQELEKVRFDLSSTSVDANALYMERQESGMALLYWLIIDKKPVTWTQQKVLELWSSLFNKKKTGLMVRMEIPLNKGRTQEEALALSREFIQSLNQSLTTEQKSYLFGNASL
ncbi:MAG: EpsI family protein [Candidatus Omnitrophica bacterium]|nr:EpsI family protein [Candidatus Omnitrophota bacterium]